MQCKRVPLKTLKPGTVLAHPITDPVDPRVILLGKGLEITQSFLDRLEARGVDTVILAQRDIAILRAFTSHGRRIKVPPPHHYVTSKEQNDQTKKIDRELQSPDVLPFPTLSSDRPAHTDTFREEGYPEDLTRQWAVRSAEQVDQVSAFFEQTMHRGASEVGPLHKACDDILERIEEDRDAFVCHACTPYESDYPSRHGFHFAGVAISIGVQLGLPHEELIELGIGCLIHDIGMESIGLTLFNNKSVLSPIQLQRLANHPVRAVAIAGRYGDRIGELSKVVAYQVHERNDGSGYPRGITAEQIHPLSKIAAVADALVGMLTRRKHRHAIQGYYVMAELLREMEEGKFDAKVMRALLNIASLYPLGSFVKLNNGCIGRVIRSGGDNFVRPTIELWHPDFLDNEPAIVNLKCESKLRITGSIANPKAA